MRMQNKTSSDKASYTYVFCVCSLALVRWF